MAFDGTLVTIVSNGANYSIPLDYIEAQTYDAQIITQDADPITSASGVLNRNVLKHRPVKVQFETIGLTNAQLDRMMAGISRGYIGSGYKKENEKQMEVRAFVPELGGYVTGKMYLQPTLEISIDTIDERNKEITYMPITFILTGY